MNTNDVVNLWNSSVLNTPKKQQPMFKRRPKPKESKPREYSPISPSKIDSLPKPKSRGESAKMDVLRYLGLLDDKIEQAQEIFVERSKRMNRQNIYSFGTKRNGQGKRDKILLRVSRPRTACETQHRKTDSKTSDKEACQRKAMLYG